MDARVPKQASFPGADKMATSNGRLLAAFSPKALLSAASLVGEAVDPKRTLVLDLGACRRALQRSPGRWSRQERGDLRAADDLLWDAAGSLGDDAAGRWIIDGDFHQVYDLLWGNRAALPTAERRLAAWDTAMAWFASWLNVIDKHDRRYTRRG